MTTEERKGLRERIEQIRDLLRRQADESDARPAENDEHVALDMTVSACKRGDAEYLDEALAADRREGAERAPQYEVTPQHMESMEEIAKLANFLSEYLPHEISRSENAVDIVIRLLRPLVESDRREGEQAAPGLAPTLREAAEYAARALERVQEWVRTSEYGKHFTVSYQGEFERLRAALAATPQRDRPHEKLDLVSGPHDEGLTFDVDDAPSADRQETPADRQSEHFKPGHGPAAPNTPSEGR